MKHENARLLICCPNRLCRSDRVTLPKIAPWQKFSGSLVWENGGPPYLRKLVVRCQDCGIRFEIYNPNSFAHAHLAAAEIEQALHEPKNHPRSHT